eukprot:CAMPEP_0206514022 /NCGR_PEP_ID=MMETSP0324_2-20121206/61877_1 /ASSEMBLY_ACC=CAM_ASM_000836 /TAXON_ID=2866 /ORGANISM="Crypthecodinium cohnii, Strain Seligo" /LENGTH=148 /DNA_ID=CAMNT_0054006391 /DNA_START=476 /DNA_END=919 /DNA_ORIENTATION=+
MPVRAVAVHSIGHPLTLIDIPIAMFKTAVAMGAIMCPLTLVHGPVRVNELSLSMPKFAGPLSSVDCPIRCQHWRSLLEIPYRFYGGSGGHLEGPREIKLVVRWAPCVAMGEAACDLTLVAKTSFCSFCGWKRGDVWGLGIKTSNFQGV